MTKSERNQLESPPVLLSITAIKLTFIHQEEQEHNTKYTLKGSFQLVQEG